MLSYLSRELFYELFSTSLAILILTVLLAAGYVYSSLNSRERWEKYGVKHLDFGSSMDVTQMAELAMREGLDTVGTWRESLTLFTRDLELAKQIAIKDFANYVNRPVQMASSSHFRKGLFFLRDDQWKRVRQLMSPSFSTSKLRGMSDVFQRCAARLAKSMEEHARQGKLVNMYHSNGQYTSAVTARTGFGLDTESNIGNPTDDKFTATAKNLLKKFGDRNSWQTYIFFFLERFPKLHLFLALNLKIDYVERCNMENVKYLDELLEQAIAERERLLREGSGGYHDFLDSLVAAKAATDTKVSKENPGLQNGSEPQTDSTHPERTLTHEEVIAQSLTLFFAGFEMTTSGVNFCLYHLALYPEIQEKVYNEINWVVHSEEPTAEELGKLHFMEQVIQESMRLLPPVGVIVREALETRTYGDITIPAGSGIYFPVFAIHHDPKHYPNPEKFDPERFSQEEKAKRDPMAFAPFGWGPRYCIGMRLFMVKIKIALVHVLRKVSFEVNEKTVPKKGGKLETYYSLQLIRLVHPMQLQVNLRKE